MMELFLEDLKCCDGFFLFLMIKINLKDAQIKPSVLQLENNVFSILNLDNIWKDVCFLSYKAGNNNMFSLF